MQEIARYKYSLLYLLAITVACYLFLKYPLIVNVTDSIALTPWVVMVGAWFVLRDFSQREIGHYVFIPMAAGIVVSTAMNASLGLANFLAVATSEILDWAIYSFTKKPFHERILLSSLVSAPVDTLIFFSLFDWLEIIPGVSIFNWGTIVLGIIAKLIAALLVWGHYAAKNKGTKVIV